MKNLSTKVVAAAVVILAIGLGSIEILHMDGQTAYAFEQTVQAMQGKCSFHILTYWGSPTRRKDEFWAEFDEHGRVTRCRQVEWINRGDHPVVVLWENGVKHQYEPDEEGGPGILLISKKEHHVDEGDLEEFDPATIVAQFNEEIEDGEVAVAIDDSPTPNGYIVVEVTGIRHPWRRVLLVDPKTKFVVRMDAYRPAEPDDGEEPSVAGEERYGNGIEVLEYNQSFDPNLFQPHFPTNTIVIDQLSREVGMAQGEWTEKEVASETVRQALEAWAADDYEMAGLLFGGAPPEFFLYRISEKPLGDIVLEAPEWMPLEPNRPRFGVRCSYVVERGGRRATIHRIYCVTTVAGQPGRWFVTPIKL